MLLKVYTDGACSKNPGPGGCAAVALTTNKDKDTIIFVETYSKEHTTNNAMEIMGVLIALKKVEKMDIPEDGDILKIEIYSDSSYVVNTITLKWIDFWIKNGWRTKACEPVKNAKLWDETYKYIKKYDAELIKVKGHSTDKYNIMADTYAVKASRKAAGK